MSWHCCHAVLGGHTTLPETVGKRNTHPGAYWVFPLFSYLRTHKQPCVGLFWWFLGLCWWVSKAVLGGSWGCFVGFQGLFWVATATPRCQKPWENAIRTRVRIGFSYCFRTLGNPSVGACGPPGATSLAAASALKCETNLDIGAGIAAIYYELALLPRCQPRHLSEQAWRLSGQTRRLSEQARRLSGKKRLCSEQNPVNVRESLVVFRTRCFAEFCLVLH